VPAAWLLLGLLLDEDEQAASPFEQALSASASEKPSVMKAAVDHGSAYMCTLAT
jgi:hypothetical protein